jgi:hypothetical protein
MIFSFLFEISFNIPLAEMNSNFFYVGGDTTGTKTLNVTNRR